MKKFFNTKTLVLIGVNIILLIVIGFVTKELLKNQEIGTQINKAQLQTSTKVVNLAAPTVAQPTIEPSPTAVVIAQAADVPTTIAPTVPKGVTPTIIPTSTPTPTVSAVGGAIIPSPTEILIARAYTPTPALTSSTTGSPTTVPQTALPDAGNPFWLIVIVPLIFLTLGFLF